MSKSSKSATSTSQKDNTPATEATSIQLARRGITTSRDFACVMSALVCDLLEGKVAPNVGNSVCNAGGKLLKLADMQQKFGVTPMPVTSNTGFVLADKLIDKE